ncbi:unnamed protein product [Lactuca saligna]|uniref:Clathrin/coatomer adaptor adaptin-like N-terminal domain-containing protein n=1 Tax=Lactuca saligna TaxID=75948 RepID=A0AA36A482_LACSI|nr:unnamed protein product [Lactuca saligna]
MKPFSSGTRLRDIIRAIRACKTAAEERVAVRKECASSLLSFLDLNHTNQYIVGLALCALGNTCSVEMARDLAPEVERLLQFRDPNIQKKATLCLIRIVKKVPNLAENLVNPVVSLLKEKHHGVLLIAIQLCTDLCNLNEEALEIFRKKCTEVLVKVLKDVVNNPYAPEYDVSGGNKN